MRKILIPKTFIVMVFILIIFTTVAYAGDLPESLLGDNSVKIFTATVTDVNKETTTIRVIHKLKGEILENQTLSLPYLEFNGSKDNKPKVNDSCIITIRDDKSYYSFKTTSTDPKTLKLLNHTTNISMNMEGRSMDERFEEYINTGVYEKSEQNRLNNKIEVGTNASSVQSYANNNYNLKFILLISGVIVVLLGLIWMLKSKIKKRLL
ncbi:hypothetical protein [Desnuesiella massiliensis]|uniref:hypothetical protein n=1 Tax=Desnuesiella massiliensis TaxID=1650662 RepID=UPI0006E3272D|nr:hypothetical protein [Desnuesiella massiliensis]